MLKKINHIDAYILAGGKSSRMGTDKGLLLFKGKTMIENIMNILTQAFERIIIVSNNIEYEKLGLKVIHDEIKDIGPAGGIHAALNDANTRKIFIMSCDMPFVTIDSILYMIENSTGTQITLPVYRGKIQPLFGVYSKNCLPVWKQLIEQEITKLQEMVTHFDLSKINVDHQKFFNEIVLMNVNDKNDFSKAIQQIKYAN